jgi:hypothetical protein
VVDVASAARSIGSSGGDHRLIVNARSRGSGWPVQGRDSLVFGRGFEEIEACREAGRRCT